MKCDVHLMSNCIVVYIGGETNSIRNPIASFFTMLHAFTNGCRMNQDALSADDSLSVIGALLQKVSLHFTVYFLPHSMVFSF